MRLLILRRRHTRQLRKCRMLLLLLLLLSRPILPPPFTLPIPLILARAIHALRRRLRRRFQPTGAIIAGLRRGGRVPTLTDVLLVLLLVLCSSITGGGSCAASTARSASNAGDGHNGCPCRPA